MFHRSYMTLAGRVLLLSIVLFSLFVPPAIYASEGPVKYLGIEHGLSNNAVTNIYQDYKGFMWFGTYDGLNRFDGYEFKIFRNRIGDNTSLIDNAIYAIEGDRQHNLWIGSRKGVCLFDPVKATFSTPFFTKSDDRSESQVTGNIHIIRADKEGNILIGSEFSGLLLFENNVTSGRQIPLKLESGNTTNYEVTAVELAAKAGQAWIFVQNQGLGLYDNRTKTIRIINNTIKRGNCLKLDKNGNCWLGNDNGLYKYDYSSNTYSNNVIGTSSRIIHLCVDRNGELWIGSDGDGVLIMHSPSDKVVSLLSADNKPLVNSNAVYSIYEDKEGRKWIGTLRGGVNVIEARTNPFKTNFFVSGKGNNWANNFILSFGETASQNIWIGTDGGGLRYWDRRKNTYSGYTHDPADDRSLSSNFITSILNDDRNNTWISTWSGGINRYQEQTHTFEHYSCVNPYTHAEEKNVWLLYEDAGKNLWASTTNNGTLYKLNRSTGRFELFDSRIVNIQCLAEDSQNGLWGGNYSSLIRIDQITKKHIIYSIGYTVRSIHEDKRGNFWVGTEGGGLLLFDRTTGHYKRFTDSDGLPGNAILRMLEDRQGNLWISTFNGLSRFDPVGRTFRNFLQSDGLQSNQFSFNAALPLRSGEFLFGGIRGFNIFFPDSVYDQGETPPIFITGVKINNIPLEKNVPYVSRRTVNGITELTVPYDRSALSIDFVALEYSSPDKINYSYYLDGWDKVWNYAAGSRTANYPRLQEGTYIFRIRATDGDGKWRDAVQTITIIVLPPWYRTWWAYLLYGLSIAAGIYLYIRYTSRQERLKYEVKLAHLQQEKEKEINEKKLSFFTDISHEFRTPLTLIINPIKELISRNDKKGEPDDLIPVVYRNARRLLSLVDQLLLFRKADTEGDRLKITRLNIAGLGHEVYSCFISHAKSKNMHYEFRCPTAELEIYGDYEKIEIALFNLLSNAFKFTPEGGTILFGIDEKDREVEISVTDTGCGIAEETGDRIFEKFRQAAGPKTDKKAGFGIGLYLVKRFISDHKGHISYRSALDKGTAFLIRLQKGTGHLPAFSLSEDTITTHGDLLDELLEEEEEPALPGNPAATADQGQTAGEIITEKKSILLIDDNPEIRHYLQQIFKNNFITYTADNGNDGFTLARTHVPDLIISDINMEGMNGVELCSAVKRTEAISHIPVILLTAASASDSRLKGIEGGADDYITKPFDKEFLMARVNNILKNRNLLQQYFFDRITLKESPIKVPEEYQHFLKQCIAIVEENLDKEDFSIRKFSLAMGMSHSSLYKKVKFISGQSVNSFIRSIRLRRAAVLMLRDHYTINQAAFQVGIGDIKFFRQQFFKLFGMNPSDYVKKYRYSFNRDFNIISPE